jgi:CheY-like chemotaxis protein
MNESIRPSQTDVYIVESDPHVRRLLRNFLADTFALVFFDDGYAALDGVRKAQPAVLITEIMIPRLDGLALCRLLKSDPLTRKVPILVFSILAAAERAQQSGADVFLNKPLEKNRLLGSLRSLHARAATFHQQSDRGLS